MKKLILLSAMLYAFGMEVSAQNVSDNKTVINDTVLMVVFKGETHFVMNSDIIGITDQYHFITRKKYLQLEHISYRDTNLRMFIKRSGHWEKMQLLPEISSLGPSDAIVCYLTYPDEKIVHASNDHYCLFIMDFKSGRDKEKFDSLFRKIWNASF